MADGSTSSPQGKLDSTIREKAAGPVGGPAKPFGLQQAGQDVFDGRDQRVALLVGEDARVDERVDLVDGRLELVDGCLGLALGQRPVQLGDQGVVLPARLFTPTDPDGIRTTLEKPRKQAESGRGGAESGAPGGKNAPADPDLALIVDRWASLPAAVRAGIVAMVKATQEGGQV